MSYGTMSESVLKGVRLEPGELAVLPLIRFLRPVWVGAGVSVEGTDQVFQRCGKIRDKSIPFSADPIDRTCRHMLALIILATACCSTFVERTAQAPP